MAYLFWTIAILFTSLCVILPYTQEMCISRPNDHSTRDTWRILIVALGFLSRYYTLTCLTFITKYSW